MLIYLDITSILLLLHCYPSSLKIYFISALDLHNISICSVYSYTPASLYAHHNNIIYRDYLMVVCILYGNMK